MQPVVKSRILDLTHYHRTRPVDMRRDVARQSFSGRGIGVGASPEMPGCPRCNLQFVAND